MVLRLSGRRIWRCVRFAIGLLLPIAAIAWLMPGPTAIEHLGPEASEQRYKQQIRSLELALEQRDTALTRERKLSRRLQQELQDASRQIRGILSDLQNSVLSAILLVMIVVVAALGLRTATLVGLAITGYIIYSGVQGGIEKAVTILMPVLFALLALLAIYNVFAGGMPFCQ